MKRTLAVLTLAVVPLLLAGCPKGTPYHEAVVAEHDFKTLVQSFQTAEMKEFQAGRISAAEHAQLEAGITKVALAGAVLVAALQKGALNSDVSSDIDNAAAAITSLLNDGVLQVKNPTSQAALKALVTTLSDILQNVAVLVKGNSVTITPGSTK